MELTMPEPVEDDSADIAVVEVIMREWLGDAVEIVPAEDLADCAGEIVETLKLRHEPEEV
jgi:hypothetical protein